MAEYLTEFNHRRSWGPKPSYDFVKAYSPYDKSFKFIAGPCSVESEFQIHQIAKIVSSAGATHLRGGIYRAGTYPNRLVRYGLIDESLIKAYSDAAKQNGLKNIIEVLDYTDYTLSILSKYCDAFQVGARAMQHYPLLRKLGETGKPIFLKRHPGSTVDEFLGSAEHLLTAGVKDLTLIERGTSTYHNDVRWTPSVHVISSVKSICDIPIVFDASHSTGRRDIVPNMALAGVAAGANGVLIEVHTHPDKSISDADQALDVLTFQNLSTKINKVREAIC